MDVVIVEFIKGAPEWFFHATSVVILVFLAWFLWFIVVGTKRFSDVIGKEDRLNKLHEELSKVKEDSRKNSEMALQMIRVLENLRNYIDTLNRIKWSNQIEQYQYLFQRLIDNLASDVKQHAGERHRCGLWIVDGNELVLVYASAGFPESYVRSRRLSIERSLAGKTHRRKESFKYDDVTREDDWERNPNSNSNYTALISIPIGEWGVLTIDALQPMVGCINDRCITTNE